MRIAKLFIIAAVILVACTKDNPSSVPVPPPTTPSTPTEPETETGYPAGDYLLPLIETTDTHGYIVYQDNGTVHYRLAYIADKANDIRGRGSNYSKERLLLLDGGDIYQGASISNLLDGEPLYVAMDMMDYDAVALGNHEFDWGLENLVDADATLPDYQWEGQFCVNEVPILCANLYQYGSRVSGTQDYIIVEKEAATSSGESVSVRVGIIGYAINYESSIMTSKFTGMGYSIREDYNEVNRLAQELEAAGKCDATILLIHGAADSAAGKLGAGSAIDLVLGGHSHTTQSGKTASGLAYLQGGRYGEHYASAKLKFTVAQKNGKAVFSGVEDREILTVDSIRDQHASAGQNANDLEEDILVLSDEALENIAEQTQSVVGFITIGATTYSIPGSGGRSCNMANWMCDITRRIGEADVSFVNGGGVRTRFPLNGQPRRDITVANVYEMFPFNNTIYIYNITYAELLSLLRYSLTSGGSSLFTSMTGVDCHFANGTVLSLVKDGVVIYQNKKWTGDWSSRSLTLAVSEYLATTQRVDYGTGLPNPLIEWNETSRLLSNDLVDAENAVRVLRREASASGGHLYIDSATHYIQEE